MCGILNRSACCFFAPTHKKGQCFIGRRFRRSPDNYRGPSELNEKTTTVVQLRSIKRQACVLACCGNPLNVWGDSINPIYLSLHSSQSNQDLHC